MIHSMTAYGRVENSEGQNSISCEIRSVNHRYSEISIRLPEELRPLEQKIRDHVVDMEFILFDIEGRKINPLEATSENPFESNRQKIYDIRTVDVRLTFRSKKNFYRTIGTDDKQRLVLGLGEGRTAENFNDKYLRDSVVVSINTRNLGLD